MTTPSDGAPDANESPADDVRLAEAPDSSSSAEEHLSPNSEAARYRVQLREAEAARDALADRIAGYQRRECESLVADLLDVPGDLWEIGQADVTDFYNEDGTVKEAELQSAASALVDSRTRLAKPAGDRHHNFGQYAPPPPAPPVGWGSVINSS